jgi:NAD(P)-dependent dehydrogenase (short-subunit alcohol dehydrogenase family)
MKIIIVGATGTIGKVVTKALSGKHEIIKASRSKGDVKVDIESADSIEKMYKEVGKFDALVSTSGDAYFGPFAATTQKEYLTGINSKLMGQINLVLIGQHYINPQGSFTLTTGLLSDAPVVYGSNASMVNAGLDGFVIAAAIELANGVRINAVSPGVVEDSPHFFDYFPGHLPVKMEKVAAGYIKSVLGASNGKIIRVHE